MNNEKEMYVLLLLIFGISGMPLISFSRLVIEYQKFTVYKFQKKNNIRNGQSKLAVNRLYVGMHIG